MLDKNPLETDVKALADIKVLMTLKENEVVYRREEVQKENVREGEASHE